jgi:hypothetical protein
MELMARFEICAIANIKNAADIKLYTRSLGLEVIGKMAIWEGEHKKILWHYVLGVFIFSAFCSDSSRARRFIELKSANES